jgi:DNA-binding transcriptional MerR regulator
MDKSPDAFRTISEAADDLDLPQHVLRFWESRFTQIKPMKRGGGRRYYRPDDVELLRVIKQLLYGEGYTIKGVQRLFKEQGARAVASSKLSAPNFAETDAEAPMAADGDVPAAKSPPPSPSVAPPRSDPPMRPPPAPAATAPPRPALASGDLAALRAVLGELREAERILAQARSA